mgnify:CR=1 FL=1
MNKEMIVTILHAVQQLHHVAFCVAVRYDNGLVVNHSLQVGNHKLKHQVHVFFQHKHIQHLQQNNNAKNKNQPTGN